MGLLAYVLPGVVISRAQAHLELGEVDQAAALLTSLRRAWPGQRPRIALLEARLAAARGDGARALVCLSEATPIRPSLWREVAAQVHGLLVAAGQVEAALEVVERALEVGHDQDLLLRRCLCLTLLGREEEAAAGYRLALARDPRCAEAMLGLAQQLARQGRNLEEAARLCQRALVAHPPLGEAEPVHEELLHTLCRVWLTLGQSEACVAYFEGLPTELGWIRAYGLAAGYAAQGKGPRAEEVLLAALADGETHPWLLQLLREISGSPLSPLPRFEVRVRLRWLGSDSDRLAQLLPPPVERVYVVGAADPASAAALVERALVGGAYVGGAELLGVTPLPPDAGGLTGILTVDSGSPPPLQRSPAPPR